ncbi:MAG: sigma-70 family RNA polymerase sigma factor [Bacteroidales bacterium]|nr:sigma-70 family RNA polymerase sigma factor [Bacteroidales bacterium]
MFRTEFNKLSDEELIGLVVKNHSRATASLVDRYKGMVFTLSYRILKNQLDAEEAAQDTFVKAFNALDSFRFDCKFSTWLYRICYNNAISRSRVYKPMQVEVETKFDIPSETTSALENLSTNDRSKYLGKAMEMLEPEESVLLTLYYVDNNNINEIAAIMNLTESNIKVKLHRGRKKLYTQLEVLLKEEVTMLF